MRLLGPTDGRHTRADKMQAIFNQLCSQLPDKLSAELQDQVRAPLFKFECILSVDDYDLEYTDIFAHVTSVLSCCN